MKSKIIAAVFALGAIALTAPAVATTLGQLESACRTGDYAACSAYNAAIIKQHSASAPAIQHRFDPFAIVPAGHTERVPKAPSGDSAAGKPGLAVLTTTDSVQ